MAHSFGWLVRRVFPLAAVAAVTVADGLVAPGVASAHFILTKPDAWWTVDAVGSPQKLGPCGDEGGGSATGKITSYQAGDTITITIDEKVFHPGHYRVALALKDRSELPAPPKVTAGSTPCGSAEIQSPPMFPVLADGVLAHTAQFSGPQSIMVKLPSNVSCTKCTLQVIQFMSNHQLNNPGGCFYHHCADIAIVAPSTTAATGSGGSGPGPTVTTSTGAGGASQGATTTGGGAEAVSVTSGAGEAPPGGDTGNKSGCALSSGRAAPAGLLIAALAGASAWRRRRARPAAR